MSRNGLAAIVLSIGCALPQNINSDTENSPQPGQVRREVLHDGKLIREFDSLDEESVIETVFEETALAIKKCVMDENADLDFCFVEIILPHLEANFHGLRQTIRMEILQRLHAKFEEIREMQKSKKEWEKNPIDKYENRA